MARPTPLLACLFAFFLSACAPGGGEDGGQGAGDQDALRAEIERLFPYSASEPLDVIYYCERRNSALQYYFHLQPSGRFDVYSTTDTGDDFTFDGVWELDGGALRLRSASFILPLDETASAPRTAMGLLHAFTTDTNSMACVAYGHRQDAPGSYGHYRCPDINIGAVSRESNALEMNHFAMPYDLQVPGSVFRQRDTYVSGRLDPLIRRGYGIYRRAGDDWYAFFPGNQFDDFAYLSGTLDNGGAGARVTQFGVGCPRS